MPPVNRFRHQVLRSEVPTSPHHLITPPPQPDLESDTFRRRMQAVGDTYRAAGVAVIYLVHGTFAGDDAFSLFAELGRYIPQANEALRNAAKSILDALVSDAGNFTHGYAQLFQQAIHRDGAREIPVRLYQWSGQNNHIGRADAAVRLIDELNRQAELRHGNPRQVSEPISWHSHQSDVPNPRAKPRILLWGHSHAGNAFAILTNLLASDPEWTNRFFSAARSYYRWPLFGCVDIPIWHAVHKDLLEADQPIHNVALDLVTFGTPIRYGWDTNGYDQLLHFVNHRPDGKRPSYLAPFPPIFERLSRAEDGDFVQQVGIAGTNFAPNIFTWRALLADYRLGRLMQPGLQTRDLYKRLLVGARIPDEGTTLLVDYGPGQGGFAQHAAGHAVYTRAQWLLFHAEEVARRFYTTKRFYLTKRYTPPDS